jgi:RNA polymerase sigma factor (sigma-70 family)
MIEVFSDQELVDRIYNNDSIAINYIYKNYYRSVKQYIKNHNGNENDAKDIFQDAMIFLHYKICNNDFKLSSGLQTYLIGISKMLWYRSMENRKRHVLDEIPTTPITENFLYDMMKLERKKIFAYHFKELPEDCQRLIILFINNTSLFEITKIMGYSSEQFTKNKRLRCKKRMLEKIMQNPYFKNP